MRVSIVLVVRDQAELLLRSLSALARLPDELDFEVVVVDDGSSDGTSVLLGAVEGDLVSLRNEQAVGFGPACDQGVASARGDVVVLLDAAVAPVDGWLEALLVALEHGAGAVRPRVVDTSGADRPGPLWSCLALRRDLYERVGGFAASARPGRAEKLTLLEALEEADEAVADEPTALVLAVAVEVAAPA